MNGRLTARVTLAVDVDRDALTENYIEQHKESPPANRYMRESVLREHLRFLVLSAAEVGIKTEDLDAAVTMRPTGT